MIFIVIRSIQQKQKYSSKDHLKIFFRLCCYILNKYIFRLLLDNFASDQTLLDDFGLTATLNWYLQRTAAETGLEIALQEDLGEARLPAAIEAACFRLVQGGLTNVVRHAHARHVVVQVHKTARAGAAPPNGLEIVVRDDGAGFDVDDALEKAQRGQSLGLLSMRERVLMVGGQITIESAPGRGTEVRVHVPVSTGIGD